MEAAVRSNDLSTVESLMHITYTQDVMHIMTDIREMCIRDSLYSVEFTEIISRARKCIR